MATKKTVAAVEKKVRYGTTEWINGASIEDLRQFARKQQPKIDLGKFGDVLNGEEVAKMRSRIKTVLANRRSKVAKARAKPALEVVVDEGDELVTMRRVQAFVSDLNGSIQAMRTQYDERVAELQKQLGETAGKEGFENLQRQITELKKQLEGLPKAPQYEAFVKKVADEVGRIPGLVKEEVGKQPAALKNGGGYVHQTDLDKYSYRIAEGLKDAIYASNLTSGEKRKFSEIVNAAREWWNKRPEKAEEAS